MPETRNVQITDVGLLTSIQDHGRSGYYHLGIPPSGAMDQEAYRTGNLLLGNPETAASLECALMGPTLTVDAPTRVAVTGAELVPKVDGEPQATYTVLELAPGQTLSFQHLTGGARAYIAFDGGIDVPVALGSRAFYSLGALGGIRRALEAGDTLPLGPPAAAVPGGRSLPGDLRPRFAGSTTLRVMPGLYDHRVVPEALTAFFGSEWKVALEADRIGYRLKGGEPLEFVDREQPFGAGDDPSNIVDAPYPVGSIQVPSGREPIILHRDAVSAGGYMMVGTVISADMDRIGQMAPRTTARFEVVDLPGALQARRERADRLQRLRDALAV